jgi:hypothetical protein
LERPSPNYPYQREFGLCSRKRRNQIAKRGYEGDDANSELVWLAQSNREISGKSVPVQVGTSQQKKKNGLGGSQCNHDEEEHKSD